MLAFSLRSQGFLPCSVTCVHPVQITGSTIKVALRLLSPRRSPAPVSTLAAATAATVRTAIRPTVRTMSSSVPAPTEKRSLQSLPISSHAPIYHLPPDPLFPTPASLLRLAEYDAPPDFGQDGPVALKEGDPVPPSMLRRSRQIRRGGCFTYVSPRAQFLSRPRSRGALLTLP